MKKLICTLLILVLAGCAKEDIIADKISSNEKEILNLSPVLSDKYYIDYDEWAPLDAFKDILLYREYNEELYEIDVNKTHFISDNEKVYKVNESKTKFISDDENIELKFEVKRDESSKYDMVAELIIYVNNSAYSIINPYLPGVSLIDLDENDGYKEIIVFRQLGVGTYYDIYRVKKDTLEPMVSTYTDGYNFNLDFLVNKKSNKKIIVDKFIRGLTVRPILSYYLYENGTFNKIEKLLTGEEVYTENGEYNKNLQKQIFEISVEDELKNGRYGDGIYPNCKIKLIKEDFTNENWHYMFEVVEDYSNDYNKPWLDENGNSHDGMIPAGTVVLVYSFTFPRY